MFRTVPVIGLGSHRVDDDLRALLLTLAPKLRDDCPRVLICAHEPKRPLTCGFDLSTIRVLTH